MMKQDRLCTSQFLEEKRALDLKDLRVQFLKIIKKRMLNMVVYHLGPW